MLGRLLLVFIAVPLVEVALLSYLSDKFGWATMLLIVIFTGALGAWLAKQQGWQVVRRLRADAADGRLPAEPLLEGVMILAAGLLLVTPGLLTDVVGFALLVPRVRRICQERLLRWIGARLRSAALGEGARLRRPPSDDVIDSYVVDGDGDNPPGEPRRKLP